MLIPLGILDYPAPTAAGSYDLLETEILTGSQASVTFSSLNSTYGADYQHLQIRAVVGRGSDNIASLSIKLNGNNMTRYHALRGFGGVVESFTGTNGLVNINGDGTDKFSAMVLDVLDPFETTKNTTTRALAGGHTSTEPFVGLYSAMWNNTAAITSIELAWSSFTADSRFSLYGLKGA